MAHLPATFGRSKLPGRPFPRDDSGRTPLSNEGRREPPPRPLLFAPPAAPGFDLWPRNRLRVPTGQSRQAHIWSTARRLHEPAEIPCESPEGNGFVSASRICSARCWSGLYSRGLRAERGIRRHQCADERYRVVNVFRSSQHVVLPVDCGRMHPDPGQDSPPASIHEQERRRPTNGRGVPGEARHAVIRRRNRESKRPITGTLFDSLP